MTVAQAPRLRLVPSGVDDDTWGALAGALASEYGLTPDPWQQLVLDDWFARRDGKWAATTCGLSVPRQNGKNALLEIRELFGLVGRGEKILHTAHELRTARKAFNRLLHFFGKYPGDPTAKYPELNELVETVRLANGQEAIYLKNGGSVEVIARSKSSGRGFTVDTLVLDEAQDLAEEDLEALLPTTSAAPLGDPQWLFTGTPPGPLAAGDVFRRVRTEALEELSALAGDPDHFVEGTCWHEWSMADGADIDDRQVWVFVNPALDSGRLQMSVVIGERKRFSDDSFARERLGHWSELNSATVIPGDTWRRQGDDTSMAISDLSIAIDVSPDRATSSVALAGMRPDGNWHIELDDSRSGTSWVVPYVKRLVEKNELRAVVIDATSPANSLVNELARQGVRVTTTQTRDMAAACGQFYDGFMDGTVFHPDQPQLSFALSNARRRTLLDSWAWNRKAATSDITPIVACTLALWGARARGVKRPRRGVQGAVFTGV